MITKEFWDEISVFTDIVIPVSGGVDSTFVYEQFRDRGMEFRLVWNNTGRSLVTARDVLVQLFLDGQEFDITYPEESQGWITRKTQKVVGEMIDGSRKINKKSIPCCYYLKEKPYYKWLKRFTNPGTLIISGLASYEGMQRNIRLGELRNRGTYLRFKKKEQRWFAYPLRDFNRKINRQLMIDYLEQHALDVKASGCYTCPILVMYEDYFIKQEGEVERVRKSKLVYR